MNDEAVLGGLGNRVRGLIEGEAGNDEPVLAAVSGREGQAAALTSHRLILAQGKLLLRGSQSVRISDIVNITSGLTGMHIELTNGSSYDFPFWPTQGDAAKAFVRKVQAAQDSAQAPSPSPSHQSVAEELTKLAQLRDQGVLTDQEFESQKASLLSRS